MASYGGFQRTNYGGGGGDMAGGFDVGGSQQGSQGGAGSKTYTDESLRPVTIKQLNDTEEPYPDADLTIDGAVIKNVTIVGQVRSVNKLPTNITYRLDDGTGTMDVKQWVDLDTHEAGGGAQELAIDQYVRAWGRVKSFNGKKHLGAIFVRPVESFDEVNYHLLEATYVHLYFTKGLGGGGGGGAAGAAGGGAGANGDGDSLFVDQGNNDERLRGCSVGAKKVYKYLTGTPGGNEGLHVNLVASGTGIDAGTAMSALRELEVLGMVYPTVDEQTYAVMDMY